jgi:hypothetical protein
VFGLGEQKGPALLDLEMVQPEDHRLLQLPGYRQAQGIEYGLAFSRIKKNGREDPIRAKPAPGA